MSGQSHKVRYCKVLSPTGPSQICHQNTIFSCDCDWTLLLIMVLLVCVTIPSQNYSEMFIYTYITWSSFENANLTACQKFSCIGTIPWSCSGPETFCATGHLSYMSFEFLLRCMSSAGFHLASALFNLSSVLINSSTYSSRRTGMTPLHLSDSCVLFLYFSVLEASGSYL